jgi:2-oxoglutarate dehydrogenase E2 component (dihydrolipoamide succinyltransferase)
MSIKLKIPAVGESVTEVQIGEWLKKEGDTVAKDENIVVIETEKATVELPAPNPNPFPPPNLPTPPQNPNPLLQA